MIESYLAELRALLPAGRRGRILAEARDHLLATAERVGEEEAISRFGSPEEIARAHVGPRALHAARAATGMSLAVTLTCGVLALAANGQRDPLSFFAGQVAIVAVAVAALRLVLLRGGSDELRLLHRCNLLAALAAVTAVAATEAYVAAVVCGAVSVAVLAWACLPLRAMGLLERAAAPAWRLGLGWGVCLPVAILAGLALATAHAIAEGPGPLLGGLAATAAMAGIEAAAVVGGYAVFGRWLGIR